MRRKDKDRELMGDTSCRDVSWAQAAGLAMNRAAFGVMLMVAITAALFLAGTCKVPAPLLLLGAVLLAACTQALTPGFWRRLRAIRADPAPVLPEADEFHDPNVAEIARRLRRARQARARAIGGSPYGRRRALDTCHAAVAELERRAIVAAARADFVRNFLGEASDGAESPDSEIARLRSAERSAACAEATTAYQQAETWSVNRRDAVRRLEARSASLMGTLEHLTAILEALPAKLTNVELLEIEEGDRLVGTDVTAAEKELAELEAPFLAELEEGRTEREIDRGN